MAENVTTEATATQKEMQVATEHKATNAVVARRLKAVQDAGNLTPKMQRGFDRLSASIANQE